MASMFRSTRRWCRTNLCTAFLSILLCAGILFAISEFGAHTNHKTMKGSTGLVADRRLTGIENMDNEGHSSKRKKGIRKHVFDDDDEDMQICQMSWKDKVNDERHTGYHKSQQKVIDCQSKQLLSFDDDGTIKVNAKVLGNQKLENCQYRGIEWMSEDNFKYSETKEWHESMNTKIPYDFVQISCNVQGLPVESRRRSRRNAQEAEVPDDLFESNQEEQNAIEKSREIANKRIAEKQHVALESGAKDLHRAVVHNNSPRVVGSVGMPDFSYPTWKSDKNVMKSKASQNNEIQDDTLVQSEHEEEHEERENLMENHPEGNNEPLQRVASEVESNRNKHKRSLSSSYDHFIIQVHPTEKILDRVKDPAMVTPLEEALDVFILVLDSMSHADFERTMPTTSEYLKTQLNSVVMNGYNVLGDAATAAVIPLVIGSKEPEVFSLFTENFAKLHTVDSLPFIWNKYEQRGYVTLYAEDQPHLGTFQTRFKGFESSPVDHYMRPFWLAAQSSEINTNSQPNCLGPLPQHQYLFQYVKEFFNQYKSIPKFAFGFLSEVFLDKSNRQQVDEDLMKFFESLQESGQLKKTVVIVIGDHGDSYGEQRNTMSGKMEERLPYLSLSFPESFRDKNPELMTNLRLNQDKLTTALDVFETLGSLLDMTSLKRPVNKTRRAMSLLHELPRTRTCQIADIDIHWCSCVHYEDVLDSADQTNIQKMAKFLVQHLNKLLEKVSGKCHQLELEQILDTKIIIPTDVVAEYERTIPTDRRISNFTRKYPTAARYYQIIFETTPGGSVFEGTVFKNQNTGVNLISGQISRINEYGDQSRCVVETHPSLRKYCSCQTN